MTYKEIDITKELPPKDDNYYIVRYNGTGSWYEDQVDEFTGKDLHGAWGEVVKSWLKPIKDD